MYDFSPEVAAAELSPEQRSVIEQMLGRKLGADEAVQVFVHKEKERPVFRGGGIIKRGAEGPEREAAAQELSKACDALDAQLKPGVTQEQIEREIEEAIREVREERRRCG